MNRMLSIASLGLASCQSCQSCPNCFACIHNELDAEQRSGTLPSSAQLILNAPNSMGRCTCNRGGSIAQSRCQLCPQREVRPIAIAQKLDSARPAVLHWMQQIDEKALMETSRRRPVAQRAWEGGSQASHRR